MLREGKVGKRGVGICEVESIGSSSSFPETEAEAEEEEKSSKRLDSSDEKADAESRIKPRGSSVSLKSLQRLSRLDVAGPPSITNEISPIPSLNGFGMVGREEISTSRLLEKAEEKDDRWLLLAEVEEEEEREAVTNGCSPTSVENSPPYSCGSGPRPGVGIGARCGSPWPRSYCTAKAYHQQAFVTTNSVLT